MVSVHEEMKMKVLLSTTSRNSECGQTALLFALLIPVLFALVGLVVDGGIMFIRYRLGRIAIDGAAYSAATALDKDNFIQSGDSQVYTPGSQEVKLSVDKANRLARQYAQDNGKGALNVTAVIVDETHVTVYGYVISPTVFMRIFGKGNFRIPISAQAELKYGIEEEGQ
jgi:Flp pilus assembly protein TadG